MSELITLTKSFYVSRQMAKVNILDLRSMGNICTALARRDPKKALLDIQTLLKRKPNDPSALALKVVAISLGSQPLTASSQQEFNKAVETIKSANDGASLGDVEIVMAVAFALRGIGKDSDALALLSRAAREHSDEQELGQEAFFQLVRSGDISQAQEISTSLANHSSQNTSYLLWSVMTIILQIGNLQHPQTHELLSLAERQASQYFSIPSSITVYQSSDDFHIASRLLELRARFSTSSPDSPSSSTAFSMYPSLRATKASYSPSEALLEHFSSPEGQKWCERNLGFELWRREVELAFGTSEGGEWRAAWERMKSSLEGGDTNWHTMLYLIRFAFAVASDSSLPTSEPANDAAPSDNELEIVKSAQQLFQRLSTESPKARVERGFPLGLLEIARENRVRGWSGDSLETLVANYFDRFSTKMCCYDDLLPYLDALNAEEISALRSKMEDRMKTLENLSLNDARTVINSIKIVRYLAEEVTEISEAAAAEEYLVRYFEALPLGKDLPPTELQPADDFALLAGQAFVSAYRCSRERSYLERAAVVLDLASRKSKYKYQARILLINIYRLLGASSLSLAHYRIFGVKNIQYDTLSHLVLNRGATFAIETGKEPGVHEEALQTNAWYKMGQSEAAQMCVQTFLIPNYGKIEDFAEFRTRLDTSLQKSLSMIEILRSRLLRGVLDTPQTRSAVSTLSKLLDDKALFSDNRDFKTLPSFTRRCDPTVWEQTALGGNTGVEWLRAFAVIYSRFLTPSAIVSELTVADMILTRCEAELLEFSSKAQNALLASLEQATEVDEATQSFFQGQLALINELVEDSKTLPWEIVHVASIALEAFSLLELGIDQRLDEIAVNKLPDQSKRSKRFRSLRNTARELLRQIGQRLAAYSKKMAKERPKIVAAISPLTSHELLDENALTNFAHALVESKKGSTEGLAATIHRRTAK